MKYLSLFSGIEACSVAWHDFGTPVAFSEIEPFPCAVLAHHYPGTPNLGDITQVTEAQIKSLGRIDVLVGGFPCQDVSVAGKRRGLRNEDGSTTRSGLFFEAMRVAGWARKHCGLRFLLIENVPGLFSSNKGADFAEVVKHMAGLDELDAPANGWGSEGCALGSQLVEWAVLDAQWFGVAQRRKRVFAVADFGDWASRAPILLERESLRGDTPPSRKAGESFTHPIAPCLTSSRLQRIGDPTGQDPVVGCRAVAIGWSEELTASVDIAGTIQRGGQGGRHDGVMTPQAQVRKLTPRECAILQGFPTNYLDIQFRNKPAADGNKYRALGNSMAVPVMRYIGQKIKAVLDTQIDIDDLI